MMERRFWTRRDVLKIGGGTPTAVWSYNGSVPGPVIEANVGDTLIVHLTNHLPEATTVHWHGVELPAEMDGSNIPLAPVPPGGTFRYEFELLTPALYWFHPHLHTNEQIEKGLHRALLVSDPDEDERLGLPQDEAILVLDDILLDDNNRLTDFATDPHAALSPLERAEEQVNGRELPSMTVRAGVPTRWRIVNVANTRFMRISVLGHDLHRIGGDDGLLEHPMRIPPVDLIADPESGRMVSNPDPAQGLLLVPGQRADVVLTLRGAPGDVVAVEWHDLPRGRRRFFFQPLEFENVDDDNPENNHGERRLRGEHRQYPHSEAPGAMGRSRAIFRAAVRFDDTGRQGRVAAYGRQPAPGFSGGWVAHCHINEHADLGMMTFTEVRDA